MENNELREEQGYKDDAGLSTYVMDLFQEFKNSRRPFEDKATEWWNNFLSQYQIEKRWRTKEGEGNRSRIFIKVTQQKCYTAHAKTMDAVGAEIPFDFEPLDNLNYADIPPEVVTATIQFRKKYIADYLKFIKAIDTIDDVVLSATIMPAAIIKGPIRIVERQAVVKRRMIMGMPAEQVSPDFPPYMIVMEPVEKFIFEEVPFWDYYVDCNVKKTKQSIGEIHYKRMSKQEFRDLMDDPGYDVAQMKEAIRSIDNLSSSLPDMDNDKIQEQLGDKFNGFEAIKDNKIPVVEFQGLVPVSKLREFGGPQAVPENIQDHEDVEAIVTVVAAGNNPVIKAQFNYFGYRQFMVVGVKKIPNTVYKNSTAGLMDDSQSVINSSTRILIDNKALSGNGCLWVNKDKIDWTKTGNAEVYPRKTFFGKGGATAAESISSITFPDVSLGLKDLMQMFMQIADEETGIPKYSQGDMSGGNFLNKTATGISMIMGAANVNLKPFLRNLDESVFEPMVERLDALFSMLGKYPAQFNIPLKVHATGTISLIARELIVENAIKLLQITSNPQDATIVKRRELIKDIAEKLGLSKFTNNEQEMQRIEMMMMQQQAKMQAEPKVDVDKLFPYMSRIEQAQVLESIGIQPDPNYVPPPPAAPAGGKAPQASAPQQMPPPGMHQMPDGSMMADSQMPGGPQGMM